MADTTLSKILQLQPEGQAAAIYLVNAYRAAGYPAIVVETRRSLQRQVALLRAGATRTLQSNHLLGRAFDLAIAGVPTATVSARVWSAGHALWSSLGGNPPISWDMVHFDWGRNP